MTDRKRWVEGLQKVVNDVQQEMKERHKTLRKQETVKKKVEAARAVAPFMSGIESASGGGSELTGEPQMRSRLKLLHESPLPATATSYCFTSKFVERT